MQKRWVIKPKGDPARVNQLSKDLNINKVLANLLVQRGINNYEEAKKYFRPVLGDLYDPFLMKDMKKAVERLNQAIEKNERILVYGDYDVDGTTAVALVYSQLQKVTDNIDFYIPDRYKEGYGVSTAGIDYAYQTGCSLIIALDCGIKSVDKVEYSNTLGVDFIICDHHTPCSDLPAAVAVLDPKRTDCSYPYKDLSGCGIGFKLMQAYYQSRDISMEELIPSLDLVVISIASDIVPITGENRVLAYYGLKQLNAYPRPGIKAMLDLNRISKELSITDIVFIIGPRINAAGRISSGKEAVELLISENADSASLQSIGINENNTERRALDLNITDQALSIIDGDVTLQTKKTTVLFNKDWHKGVIGIVASRLTEKYYRPTIVLTESNGLATGSARSVKNFDLYSAIENCSDLLEQFGGHMYAAGLTMKVENVPAFQAKFEEVVSATIEEQMLTQEIEIDDEIELSQISPAFFNVLNQFAPFGPGNMMPVFKSEKMYDSGYAKVVGTKHLKLYVAQNGAPAYGAIAFGQADKLPGISHRNSFDACYTVEENIFNDKKSLQLNIKDLTISV
jgi:single-stranded-DNA-specific exonuclease